MKKLILLPILLVLILPLSASAAISKRGKAISKIVSQASTSNSISLKNEVSEQLFDALTTSAGLTSTEGEIEGQGPAFMTVVGLGAGEARAWGRNTGQQNGAFLPEIKGISESMVSLDSQSFVSLD